MASLSAKQSAEKQEIICYAAANAKEFLNEQSPQSFFPMIAIMTELGKEYLPKITAMNEYDAALVAQAFGVAYGNKNADENNYLSDFCNGLKDILDNHPGRIGEWAMTISECFLDTEDPTPLLRDVA